MAGAFTSILMKYLTTVNLELNELVNRVTEEVVAEWGEKQIPVCVRTTSQNVHKTYIRIYLFWIQNGSQMDMENKLMLL
jgi:hypothetical protein